MLFFSNRIQQIPNTKKRPPMEQRKMSQRQTVNVSTCISKSSLITDSILSNYVIIVIFVRVSPHLSATHSNSCESKKAISQPVHSKCIPYVRIFSSFLLYYYFHSFSQFSIYVFLLSTNVFYSIIRFHFSSFSLSFSPSLSRACT